MMNLCCGLLRNVLVLQHDVEQKYDVDRPCVWYFIPTNDPVFCPRCASRSAGYSSGGLREKTWQVKPYRLLPDAKIVAHRMHVTQVR